MRSQLEKISLVDTSSLSDTLTFSVVQEGAEEASRQVLSIEPASEPQIENSQIIITSKNYDLTVVGLFSSNTLDDLETWATDQTPLIFTGYGIGGQILQMEGTLNVNQGFDENASFRFTSPREASGGYNSSTGKHTARLSYSKNGLALYKWQEGSTPGVAAGWSQTDAQVSFTGGVQSVNTDAVPTSSVFTRDIYFPFEGKTVSFFIDVDTVTVADSITIGIEAYDSSGLPIGSESTTAIASTGVESVERELPSGTQYIRLNVNLGDDDEIDFKDPTLQLTSDATTNYNFVEFNT